MGWTDFIPGGNYLDSFLHPERGYEDAQREARKYWEDAKRYQEPFMEHGLDQYGRLNEGIGRLLDPTKLQSDWASSYEQSPYAKRALEMNTGQGMDAASQMGLMGSSAALGNIQRGAGDIVARDRKQYMEDLMNKYMSGLGLGQNIYGIGASTAGNLGNQAMGLGGNMAGLAYGRANAPGNLLGGFLGMGGKGLGQAAMNYMAPGSGSMMGASNMYNA